MVSKQPFVRHVRGQNLPRPLTIPLQTFTGMATEYSSGRPHKTLEAAALGNYPVDLLACVPPQLVKHDADEACSVPGRKLIQSGKAVWDASAVDVRSHFPTDRDALRIVQYDSCRDREGWTEINYALDQFWTYKYEQWLASPQELGGLFDTSEERAAAFASRWGMIPLTRAMDTLVINISTQPGAVLDALKSVRDGREDFVDWVVL